VPIIHKVEQLSDAWFKLRSGKPTSSNFSKIITGSGEPSKSLAKYAITLATEAHLGHPINDGFQGNKYTDRGTELEPESVAEYEMLRQVKVEATTFITDDLLKYGCSCDGFIGDDGVLEIKNLISTTFFESLIYFKKHGKTEPKYVPQLMGELFITKRKWVDLMLYNPDFSNPIIHRHYPDAVYFRTLKKQLDICIAEKNRLLKSVKGEA